jgi:hypothetical protein
MAQHTASSRSDENSGLSLALGQIEKQYGKGAIMRLASQIADIPVIPLAHWPRRALGWWYAARTYRGDLRTGSLEAKQHWPCM